MIVEYTLPSSCYYFIFHTYLIHNLQQKQKLKLILHSFGTLFETLYLAILISLYYFKHLTSHKNLKTQIIINRRIFSLACIIHTHTFTIFMHMCSSAHNATMLQIQLYYKGE